MALPDANFSKATITNPQGVLDNNLIFVDLSLQPDAFWDDVNTSDGTRGRVSNDNGNIELAIDWVNFNDVAKTGFLWINWTGKLLADSVQKIRIYAPNTRNIPVASTDTYGSDACYDGANTYFYSPNGGNDDRASNSITMTEFGGVVSGGATGKIGDATDYNGTTQYVASAIADEDQPLTFIVWNNTDTHIGTPTLTSMSDGGGGVNFFDLYKEIDSTYGTFIGSSAGAEVVRSPEIIGDGVWAHVAGTFLSQTEIEIYTNGDFKTSKTTFAIDPTVSVFSIGADAFAAPSFFFDGKIQHVFVFNEAKSEDWINYHYQQTNDNETFWGEWTFGPETSEFCERAIDRLIEQFEQKQNFQNYLCALITPFDDLQDVFNDLQFKRNLDAAEGAQLDGIGEIVGLARGGLSDDDYRTQIRIQIIINASNGETESIIAAMLVFAGGTFANVVSLFPAGIIVESDGTVPLNIIQLLEQVAQAGVRLEVYATYGDTPFAFAGDAGDPADPSTEGFSEPNYAPDAGKGGSLVEKFS